MKEEVKGLKEELSGFSHFENVQVTSEMKSIEIEEQLEKLENENKLLNKTIENGERDRRELEDRIEEILKEKQDLSNKLDNCIQVSNMKQILDSYMFNQILTGKYRID